ncbi:MAG TPA: hypothetical protein VK045_10320, partial [Ornithinicoccus sp.]|nr:hypothetical protein [Ornithinicoccus sp.]
MRLAVLTGVAPQVIDELASADHAGHHRTGVDPDADVEPRLAHLPGDRDDVGLHRQGHPSHRLDVPVPLLGDPAGDHVGVTDGLDLLQTLGVGVVIERGEDAVQ